MIKTLNILITRSLYIYNVPRQRPIPKTEDRAVAAANTGLDSKSAALLVLEKGLQRGVRGGQTRIDRAGRGRVASGRRSRTCSADVANALRSYFVPGRGPQPTGPTPPRRLHETETVGAETRGEKREVDRIKMQRELWTDACNAESARVRLVNEARREGLENTFGFITVALTKTLQERVMNYDVGAFGAELQGR